jgi:PAS domain S-box-containing protein
MASFCAVLFLVLVVASVTLVIPRVSAVLEQQHSRDINVSLDREVALFLRYIEQKRTSLADLASLPVVKNSVIMSDATPAVEFFESVMLDGAPARVVLRNIDSEVLLATSERIVELGTTEFNKLLSGQLPYDLRLLSQSGGDVAMQISLPVTYHELVEGVISAEFMVSLNELLVANRHGGEVVGIQVTQGDVTVSSNLRDISEPRVDTIALEHPPLTFSYITDNRFLHEREQYLRNTLLLVLLGGFFVALLLFAWLESQRQTRSERDGTPQRSLFFGAYIIPSLVGALGIIASVAAYLYLSDQHQTRLDTEAERLIRETAHAVDTKIDRRFAQLYSLQSLFLASEQVERSEFAEFVAPIIDRFPDLQGIAWVPRVAGEQRTELVMQARVGGLPDYEIRQLNPDGGLQPATSRDTYYPVYYVEPFERNRRVVGVDLGADPTRLDAILKSRQNRDIAVSEAITLMSMDAAPQAGAIAVLSVYTDTERQAVDKRLPKGYLVGALRFSQIFAELESPLFVLSVVDVTNQQNRNLLFGGSVSEAADARSRIVVVGDRRWQISISNMAILTEPSWLPMVALFAGFAITAALSLGLVHLVNRRKLVEGLVQQRTADLQLLTSTVANANDSFVLTEARPLSESEGGPKIVYVNEAFTRLTGYAHHEIIGRTPRFLQGADTDPSELRRLREALENRAPFLGVVVNYRKDGSPFWVELNVAPVIDMDGEVSHFTAVERDVTSRRQYERERSELIEQLENANEELSRFAYVCSHDLQEPLRMVQSFSAKLQAQLGGKLAGDEKSARYLAFLTDGAERAQSLIADVLLYSSLDRRVDELVPVDLNRLLDTIRIDLQAALKESGGTLVTSDLPLVMGNPGRLYQLLSNLILNSLKYRQTGVPPVVNIECKLPNEKFRQSADSGVQKGFYHFCVTDNGIGIPPQHTDRVFAVFQRLHSKRDYPGTGIGLAICKKIVEQQGGTIWLESQPGTGTRVHFTLRQHGTEKAKVTSIATEHRYANKAC